MSETLNTPPTDPEETLLRMAVERGWLTAAQAQEATLTRLGQPGKTLLSQVPLTDEQKTRLMEELPEAQKATMRVRRGDTTRPGPAPEIAEAMKDPSRRIGRYIVVNHLKSGGMGMVFRAWDPELSRWVALKLMRVQGDPTALAYFEREARLAASLTHPNIAAIYEIGRHEGMPFIAMQYIDGPNLADARKDLKRDQVVRLLRDVSTAVHSAHQAGIVHRDLKPANLMTDSAGRVYVMDFGLAKQAELTGLTSARLSVSGTILGTPAYMPPEQARGDLKAVDAQSDVYSLGATLYDMFTFRPPFKSDSPAEVLVQVLNEEPVPPRKLAPDLPEDLATITLKCLEKDKARRYATAQEVADDLDRYARGEPILAHAPSTWYLLRKRVARNRAASAAIAAFVLLVAGLLAYFLGPSSVDLATPSGPVRRHLWPAGTHIVRLTHEGYDSVDVEVTTKPWRTIAAKPAWERSEGFLQVMTSPPGAEVTVLVDGRPQATGHANGGPIKVRKGTHEVRLRLPDHEEISAAVYVPPGQTAQLVRDLAHDIGYLTVSCDPDEVTMRIGDRIVALPTDRLPLPTGRHVVYFDKENHFTRSAEVVIRKGAPAALLPRAAPGETTVKWRRDPAVTYTHASLNPMELWTLRTGEAVLGRILAADFDEDGIDDGVLVTDAGRLQAVSGATGTILWQTEAGSSPLLATSFADRNADGVPDCFLTDVGRLRVLSGRDGRPLWQSHVSGRIRSAPAVADLDGDGIPDCVVGTEEGSLVAISGATNRPLWSVGLGGAVRSAPAIGDLNLDGVPDAVVGCGDAQVCAVSGDTGAMLWTVSVGHFVDASPALADLDGDGRLDAVVGTVGGHVAALSGRDGALRWRFRTGGPIRGTPAVAYLDGDPVPDVIAGSRDGSIYAASGTDGSWIWEYRTGGPVSEPAAGTDLDGDGLADFVACSDDGFVHAVSGEDGSLLWRFRTGSRAKSSPAMSDLDGDGLTDCIVGTESGRLHAFLGRDTRVTWHRSLKTYMPFRPRSADLDGDGVEDYLVPGTDWELTALSGADGGTLWEVQTGGTIRHLSVRGDLDGDGAPDPLVGLAIGDTVALSGRSGTPIWKVSGWVVHSTSEAEDLDGDGVADLVRVSGDQFQGISGRTGAIFPLATLTIRPGSFLGSADLDRDGHRDAILVRQESKQSYLAVHSGRDGRRIWEQLLAEGPVDPVAWNPVDLDGDGRLDVAVSYWGEKGAGPLRAHSGVDGRLLWEHTSDTGRPISSVQFIDLDRDRRPEVLLTLPEGLTAIKGSDGRPFWSNVTGPMIRIVWSTDTGAMVSPILRDIDGDGITDALVQIGGFLVGCSGATGRSILWVRRTGLLDLHGDVALYGGGRRLSVERFRVPAPPLGVLVQAGLWDAVTSRVTSGNLMGSTLDRQSIYWKGLAALRSGWTDSAIASFKEALGKGLRSPALFADRIEAELKAGSVAPPVGDLPEDGVAMLLAGRLNEDDLVRLVDASLPGTSLPSLLLSLRGEEALKRLARMDEDSPTTASLKAVALTQRPDKAAAVAVLERAARLHPYDRGLRRQLEWTRSWDGRHALFGKGDQFLEKKKWKEAADEFTRIAGRVPRLAAVFERRARAHEGSGDQEGALADYQRYISLGGVDADAFARRGRFLMEKGDYDAALRDFDRAVELEPESGGHRQARGEARYWKRDYDGAIADFTRASALEPKNPLPLAWRADTRRAKKDPKGSLEDFDAALALRQDIAWIWNNRGITRTELGDQDGAIADYSKAIELSKGQHAVHYSNRGAARRRKKDWSGAVEDYTRALELDAGRTADWNDRGLSREELEDLEGAIADYTRAIEISKGRHAVNFDNRARARQAKGDLKGALEDRDQVLALRTHIPDDWNDRGILRYRLEDYDGAITDFGRAIELDPKSPVYHHNRGQARRERGDSKGAIGDFDRAIQLQPGRPNYFVDRGWLKFGNEDYAAAEADAEAALKLKPDEPETIFLRGVSRRRLERWDEAIADFNRMLTLVPKSAKAYNNRGLARQGKKDLEAAQADFDRAIELDPKEPQFRINRGVLIRERGNPAGSVADFTAALELRPKDLTAWFERGESRRQAGDFAAAVADFTKGLDLGPRYPGIWRRRGLSRAETGDLDGAIEDLVHALSIASKEWSERATAQQELEALRDRRRKGGAK